MGGSKIRLKMERPVVEKKKKKKKTKKKKKKKDNNGLMEVVEVVPNSMLSVRRD